MNLKDGDKVTLDGVEMEVTQAPPDGYWLKQTGTSSYFYLHYRSKNELDDLYRKGRLHIGKQNKSEPGSVYCSHHTWKKYVGIREVYQYCTNCNAKEFKEWRLIVDEKDY